MLKSLAGYMGCGHISNFSRSCVGENGRKLLFETRQTDFFNIVFVRLTKPERQQGGSQVEPNWSYTNKVVIGLLHSGNQHQNTYQTGGNHDIMSSQFLNQD